MKYTVIWKPEAEQELADLWVKADDRNVIAETADQIDALLRQNAHELGESRTETTRTMVVPPLGIQFEVQQDDCMVYVLAVWRYRLGRPL